MALTSHAPLAFIEAPAMPVADPWRASDPAPAGYLAQRGGRRMSLGLMLSILVHLVAAALFLVHWQNRVSVVAPPEPLVAINLMPLAAPPEPQQDIPPGPRQIEREVAPPETPQPQPPEIVIPRRATISPPPVRPQNKRDPGPAAPETTAPKTLPAPPAPQISSNARDSWEGRLLAHLEKYRRYPGNARAQGVQGTVHIRFRMNRQGRVLSSAIQRSSGSALLDKSAMDTLKRAQPLPGIPEGMPAEMDLSVPVEYFIGR